MDLYQETIDLPSGRQVVVREMTTREEGILSDPRALKNGDALEKVLRACVLDQELDLGTLLVGDRYFLLLAIRRLSFGEDYAFRARCPHCGHGFEAKVDLTELPVKTLQGKEDQTHETKLPRSSATVRFKLLRGKDEKRLTTAMKKTPEDLIRLSLEMHTVGITDGEGNDVPVKPEFFADLPARDSQAYRAAIDAVTCGVDTEVTLVCPACDNDLSVNLPIDESFFFPRTKTAC